MNSTSNNSIASGSDPVITKSEEFINGNGENDEKYQPTTLTEAEIAAEVCHIAGNPTFCKVVKAALKMENQSEITKKSFADLMSLPTREYLDLTVVPILTSALIYLGKERPVNPIIALASFLIKNKAEYEASYDPGQATLLSNVTSSRELLITK
ncbi:dosage compensation protein dpy-30-like [Diabrotica virgifera virgifera]|uniref:Dosage compensation protein dpy-30-like n=1 Tax=Diabrotica virgifera virgifera TaxID=50390 RepID=A0A6P7H1M4_DIAVI|nr:dosage compensation protein dpy-30-like [Diabrotica virgifera virgifera]